MVLLSLSSIKYFMQNIFLVKAYFFINLTKGHAFSIVIFQVIVSQLQKRESCACAVHRRLCKNHLLQFLTGSYICVYIGSLCGLLEEEGGGDSLPVAEGYYTCERGGFPAKDRAKLSSRPPDWLTYWRAKGGGRPWCAFGLPRTHPHTHTRTRAFLLPSLT